MQKNFRSEEYGETCLGRIMQEQNISVSKLSILSRCSEASIRKYLKRKVEPTLEIALNISKALNRPFDEVWEDWKEK